MLTNESCPVQKVPVTFSMHNALIIIRSIVKPLRCPMICRGLQEVRPGESVTGLI